MGWRVAVHWCRRKQPQGHGKAAGGDQAQGHVTGQRHQDAGKTQHTGRQHQHRAGFQAAQVAPNHPQRRPQARAGCKLLLCMAGNWKNISQCEPTVRQALRDAARGRNWPTCSMGGSSASANQYVAPQQCAPQYRTSWEDRNGNIIYSCPYSGVIHVAIEGEPWSRTCWSPSGDSVVEWLPAAKAAFAGTPDVMDDRFDRDHAIWAISEQTRLAAEVAAEAAAGQGGGW